MATFDSDILILCSVCSLHCTPIAKHASLEAQEPNPRLCPLSILCIQIMSDNLSELQKVHSRANLVQF